MQGTRSGVDFLASVTKAEVVKTITSLTTKLNLRLVRTRFVAFFPSIECSC